MVGVNPSCFVEDSFVEYIQEGLCNPRHVESDTWIIGIVFDFLLLELCTEIFRKFIFRNNQNSFLLSIVD